jgi:alpha-tubulin suppressor-like RCC1 family protein
VKVAGLTGKAISVSAGDVSACAVMAAGTVECWGADDDGELGNGTTTENVVSTPAEVMGLTGVTSVSVGFRAACAVASGSDLWCWGANFSGQLGNGGAANSSVPVRVSMK